MHDWSKHLLNWIIGMWSCLCYFDGREPPWNLVIDNAVVYPVMIRLFSGYPQYDILSGDMVEPCTRETPIASAALDKEDSKLLKEEMQLASDLQNKKLRTQRFPGGMKILMKHEKTAEKSFLKTWGCRRSQAWLKKRSLQDQKPLPKRSRESLSDSWGTQRLRFLHRTWPFLPAWDPCDAWQVVAFLWPVLLSFVSSFRCWLPVLHQQMR